METPNIRSVLWDISSEKIAAVPDSFVIERTLSYGTIPLLVSVIRKYGIDQVKKVFNGMKSTAMPVRKHHYIKTYLLS